jgi:hypothetical protein
MRSHLFLGAIAIIPELLPGNLPMKNLIAVAVLCALAAGTRAASAPDSWVALASPPEGRSISGESRESFAAGSDERGSWDVAGDGVGRIDADHGDGSVFGNDDSGGTGLDDLGGCQISATPEPSTWQFLALGVGLLSLLGLGRTRDARDMKGQSDVTLHL